MQDVFLLQILLLFQAPLCPSLGAREYYTDGCCHLYNILELLMMGIMVPETY